MTKPKVNDTLYRLIVEQTRDYAVFALDLKGHIVTWNLGAQRLKGYAPSDIIGRHFSVFYTRDAVERGWPDYELRVATTEGRFEDEGWRVRKDGSRFWANVVITALRDENGRHLGFSKFTRDLTERKQHEEQLRQSEERFRLLVEGVEDCAIFMLEPEGFVSSWNSGAQRITGYTREEILGKHYARFYTADDIEAGKPWAELALARRTGRVETEAWRLKKDGSRFWARTVLTALFDGEGTLRGFAKLTQDLSDRRHIQDLEKAAQNVNEFIAVLAHEMRNPLAPIRNAVQVMKNAPADAAVQAAMRETIDRQSAQLARIVDDMLDISKITRGKLTVDLVRVDLGDVVRGAIETAMPAFEAGGQHVEIDLPSAPLTVNGDPHRLAQLLSNLLGNAARYTPSGGRVTITARAHEGKAVVTVRDTGCGIAPAMLERIFDMFVQGRPALQRVGGGLGIGLALARRLAELHGGTLTAASEGENRGSEFTFTMPLAEGMQTAAAERSAPEPVAVPPLARRRVLVVDDNVDAAVALGTLLESLGHETCVVHDGAGALRTAPEFKPDIVLLDIGMPGLDGYEVARRLRAGVHRSCRIVALTGWGQDADRKRSREAGFDLHLVKPVDSQDLVRVLGERGGATLH